MSAPEGDAGPVAAHHVDGVIAKADVVLPAVADGWLPATTAEEQTLKLQELARGICERERALAACARTVWLENGLALSQAKEMLGHGRFEAWCERELSYKKSTAENMIRAARVLGPAFRSVTVMLLPAPTLAYELSRQTLQTIRDKYVPRMVAGEMVEDEVWAAIEQHRRELKDAKKRDARGSANAPEEQKAGAKCEVVGAHKLTREVKEPRPEQEDRASAQSAALNLIVARLGDDLPQLLALVAQAGGKIFSAYAESELQARVREMAAGLVCVEVGGLVSEPDVTDAEIVTAPSDSISHAPPGSAPVPALIAQNPIGSMPAEPVIADVPPPATSVIRKHDSGKYGDLASLVSMFPTARRKK